MKELNMKFKMSWEIVGLTPSLVIRYGGSFGDGAYDYMGHDCSIFDILYSALLDMSEIDKRIF